MIEIHKLDPSLISIMKTPKLIKLHVPSYFPPPPPPLSLSLSLSLYHHQERKLILNRFLQVSKIMKKKHPRIGSNGGTAYKREKVCHFAEIIWHLSSSIKSS
jgi:hypothetical protein